MYLHKKVVRFQNTELYHSPGTLSKKRLKAASTRTLQEVLETLLNLKIVNWKPNKHDERLSYDLSKIKLT